MAFPADLCILNSFFEHGDTNLAHLLFCHTKMDYYFFLHIFHNFCFFTKVYWFDEKGTFENCCNKLLFTSIDSFLF